MLMCLLKSWCWTLFCSFPGLISSYRLNVGIWKKKWIYGKAGPKYQPYWIYEHSLPVKSTNGISNPCVESVHIHPRCYFIIVSGLLLVWLFLEGTQKQFSGRYWSLHTLLIDFLKTIFFMQSSASFTFQKPFRISQHDFGKYLSNIWCLMPNSRLPNKQIDFTLFH